MLRRGIENVFSAVNNWISFFQSEKEEMTDELAFPEDIDVYIKKESDKTCNVLLDQIADGYEEDVGFFERQRVHPNHLTYVMIWINVLSYKTYPSPKIAQLLQESNERLNLLRNQTIAYQQFRADVFYWIYLANEEMLGDEEFDDKETILKYLNHYAKYIDSSIYDKVVKQIQSVDFSSSVDWQEVIIALNKLLLPRTPWVVQSLPLDIDVYAKEKGEERLKTVLSNTQGDGRSILVQFDQQRMAPNAVSPVTVFMHLQANETNLRWPPPLFAEKKLRCQQILLSDERLAYAHYRTDVFYWLYLIAKGECDKKTILRSLNYYSNYVDTSVFDKVLDSIKSLDFSSTVNWPALLALLRDLLPQDGSFPMLRNTR